MKSNNIQNISSKYLILVISSLLLTPSVPLPSFPAIRIEEIICIIYILHISYLTKGKNNKLYIPKPVVLFYVIILFLTLSIINGYLNSYSTSIREVLEYIVWFKFLVIYIMAANSHLYRDDILKALKISTILLFALTLSQYFNFLGLNNYYINFVAPTQSETLLNNYVNPRAVGMVGNPNALAYIFILTGISAFYFLLNYTVTKINVLWFISSSIGIVLTQSRTAFISYIVGLLLLTLTTIFAREQSFRNIVEKLFMITIIPVSFYLILQNDYIQERYLWRFGTVVNYETSASWQQRLINWSENIELIKSHFIIGVGPLKGADFLFPADNEWLLLLRVHGVIGTSIIILLLFSFLKFNNKDNQIVFAIIISTFIYMIAAAVINSLILMPILIIILSVFTDFNLRSNKNENMPYYNCS